ncbi:TPA: hypothetical protein QC118_004657, partial [Bacillus cereus]|nr:hypothetical protein [Bacillus cereus]
MYYYDSTRPPMPSSGTVQHHLLPQITVEQYLQSCKGQYIRTNMSGSGTIIARLLGYDNTSGMVQLDIAYPRYLAGFIEVHRSDLTGISCLGWTLPPQYSQPRPPMPSS